MAAAPGKQRHEEGRDCPSLDALFDDALPRIYGYILVRVCGDRAVAEELTQETMLALATALAGPHPRIADPLAWLFGTARFKLIDHYRRRERYERAEAEWSGDLAELPGEIDDLDRIAEREELIAALAMLPAGQRIALVLHYADGLSVREVAEALGKSGPAVESLLARGRRSLRALLADQETDR
jgi:RNA polymerase sigma-70 factor (ECF subfamily)